MTLTDAAIRNAKPREKPYKISDAKGLYLQINPHGSKLWRLKYRIHGAERKLALGAYPEVSLAEAREARAAVERARELGDGAKVKLEELEQSAREADWSGQAKADRKTQSIIGSFASNSFTTEVAKNALQQRLSDLSTRYASVLTPSKR